MHQPEITKQHGQFAFLYLQHRQQLESLEMMHRRVDGLICFLFVKGTINVKFNSDEFVIDKPSLLVAPHRCTDTHESSMRL